VGAFPFFLLILRFGFSDLIISSKDMLEMSGLDVVESFISGIDQFTDR